MVGLTEDFQNILNLSKLILTSILLNVYQFSECRSLPYDWHHDINVGGGRLIHEGVHFIDLANYLIGESDVFTSSILDDKTNDKFTINLSYSDGSIASIHYWAKVIVDSQKRKLLFLMKVIF